jgi:capsular exopolysaccharide synthesis family protein
MIVAALVAGAITYAVASRQPKAFEATATLIVDPGPSPTTDDLEAAQGQLALYAGQAGSPSTAATVAKELGLDESPESLLERISVDFEPEDLILTVTARDGDAEAARVLAATVGEETRSSVRDRLITDEVRGADRAIRANQSAIRFSQRRLNSLIAKPNKTFRDRSDVQALFAQISSLQSDILQLQPSSSAFVRNKLNWFEQPSASTSPVGPQPWFWAMLALVAGGMFGLAAGFLIEFANGKVRDERDLEAATGSAALGVISERRGDIRRGDPERLVVLRHPHSQEVDSYRSLRARISLASGTARTLLVTGADRSDGQSAVAANLAVAYAEAGSTVILVDADLRSPRLHRFFGVANERGLSILLSGNEVPLSFVTVPTSHPRLRLMPAGPASIEASELLVSAQVPRVLGRLLQVADMVVMDGPSMTTNLDAAMLATYLQSSILVVPSGSRINTVTEATRALGSDDARFSGAVLYRTARGSHGRAYPRPALSLPAPRILQPSPQAGMNGEPESHPSPPDRSAQASGAYLLVAALYRIVRGPHARPVAEPETRSVNGRTAGAGSSDEAVGRRSAAPTMSPGRPQNGQGAPAAPWPTQSRPPVAVPVETPAVASVPQAGPYAGGYKPGEGDR